MLDLKPDPRLPSKTRDRSESTSQAKKARGGSGGRGKDSSKREATPQAPARDAKRTEKVPPTTSTGNSAGLSKTKQKTLTDVTKIVTNALGPTAASQVVDTYLKQQQVLQQIKEAPKSVKGRKPESTQISSSVYPTEEPKDSQSQVPSQSKATPVVTTVPVKPDGSPSDDTVMATDSEDGTSNSGRPAQATLGPIPPPSIDMSRFWDPRISQLQTALVTEASQCLQHQVEQFERAFLAGGELAHEGYRLTSVLLVGSSTREWRPPTRWETQGFPTTEDRRRSTGHRGVAIPPGM